MKPGLLPRLIAAAWFAVAACVPVGFAFLLFGLILGESFFGMFGWLLFVVPIAAASFVGFAIGAAILDPLRTRSVARSIMLGLAVAVLSYLALFGVFAVSMMVRAGQQETGAVLGGAAFVFVFGTLYVGVPVVVSGALAGLVLYQISLTERVERLLAQSPRVSRQSWNLLTVLGALIFGVICLLSVIVNHRLGSW